jgi:hypothetical protein
MRFPSGGFMSLRNRIILSVIALLTLAFLVGCGSSSHSITPPPSGGFTDANLSGTYVFSIVGSETVGGDLLSITGTFTANGQGSISGGAVDFNDSDTNVAASSFPNVAVSSGTYNVTADGRGQAILTMAELPWTGTTFTVDFVLASNSSGLITQFDTNGTGSGTLALQSAAGQPAAANYVLALSGINGQGLTPGAIAGAVAVDGSGNITGAVDFVDNGNWQSCNITSGTITVGSTSPGTASIATSCGTAYNFDVYEASGNDYKFIETDQFPNFSGDLFLQASTAFPSGQIVFTMAGSGTTAGISGSDLVTLGGLMTSDGSSTLSNGEEDYNDDTSNGPVSNINLGVSSTPNTFAGTITPPVSGSRYVLGLTTFENGQGQTAGYTFAAYPYSSTATVLIEIDSLGISAGTAYSQSNTSLASAQGYGMNLTGTNSGGEEDDIAEFTANNGSFSNGTIDMNDEGTTLFDKSYSGTYGMDSPATGRGELGSTTPESNINVVFYTASNTQTVFVEVDPTQLGLGTLLQQSATSSQSAIKPVTDFSAQHLVTLKAAKAMKAKKAAEKK